MARQPTAPRVVVIGAGFAGLAAARELSGGDFDVTLVDRHIYSTFQPLLYQVATGGLNPGDVSYPIRSFTRAEKVRFLRGEVASIDTDGDRILLGSDKTSVAFDYLVIASGAAVNYFDVPGAAEHAMSLYRRADAVALRDQMMGLLEEMAAGRLAKLSIVVIGGGATGVEMAGSLAELRDAGLGAVYPEIDRALVRVLLLEQGERLLAGFDERLGRYALDQLERRGVQVLLGTTVGAVTPGAVQTAAGEALPADLTIWAAGVAAPAWGLPRGRGGRIAVREDLRVEGLDRVFAVGDVAFARDEPTPQLAQPAIQMGRHAGRQVRRLAAGEGSEPFRYKEKGTMATIGRRAAVVELPGHIRLTGTVAWLAWIGLHIVTLLGNRNRLSALLNLSWRYVNWPRGSGVIVGDLPDEGTRAD